ncbi:hypothetical protein QO501_004712 [Salmonella enterica]|nr:hypothetical protein [Salmonella enterica]
MARSLIGTKTQKRTKNNRFFTISPVVTVFLESVIPINNYEFIAGNYRVAFFSSFSQLCGQGFPAATLNRSFSSAPAAHGTPVIPPAADLVSGR